jgi:hypothetical protein
MKNRALRDRFALCKKTNTMSSVLRWFTKDVDYRGILEFELHGEASVSRAFAREQRHTA